MAPDHTTTRRGVLLLSGTVIAAGAGAGTVSADHSHADVQTDPATNVETVTATLNGDLVDMGGADSVDVWFEWGEKGTGLPNATTRQSRTSPGDFSEDLIFDDDDTTYEFRAMSDTGSVVESGSVLEFTTDDEMIEPIGGVTR